MTAIHPPTPAPSSHGTSSTWQSYRWTIAEYRQLGATGFFNDLKTMLIDGEIFTMVLPNPPHDVALGLTDDWLRSILPPGYHVRNQNGFDIGTMNDPGPDLAVVPGAIRDYATHTPTQAILIVEIADSSLFIDTTTKAELYATAQVPEYWVIDLTHRQLIVYRDPVALASGLGATAYRTRLTMDADATVSPLALPTASVRVADLLP